MKTGNPTSAEQKLKSRSRSQRGKGRRAADGVGPSSAPVARFSRAPAPEPMSATIWPPRPLVPLPRSLRPPRKSLAPPKPDYDLPVGRYVVRGIARTDPDFIAALRAWPPRFSNDLPPLPSPSSDDSSSDDEPPAPVVAPAVALAAVRGGARPLPQPVECIDVQPRSLSVSSVRRVPTPPAAGPEVAMTATSSDGDDDEGMHVDPLAVLVRPPIVIPVPRSLPVKPPLPPPAAALVPLAPASPAPTENAVRTAGTASKAVKTPQTTSMPPASLQLAFAQSQPRPLSISPPPLPPLPPPPLAVPTPPAPLLTQTTEFGDDSARAAG